MRHLSIALIFVALFFSYSSWGITITPLSTIEQKRRAFSVTKDEYQDIRIDSNLDKKIDFWRVKNRSLLVDTYFQPKKTIHHLRRFDGAQVHEKVLVSTGGKLFITLSRVRKQTLYTYSVKNPLCESNHEAEWKKFIESSLDAAKYITPSEAAEKSLADTCFELADEGLSAVLVDSIQGILAPPRNTPATDNKTLSCLESPNTQSLFLKEFGPEAGKTKFDITVINMKNSIIGFSSKEKSPTIFCKQTDETNPTPPMRASERGQIQVLAPKPPAKLDSKLVKRQLFHEVLHGTGIEGDDLIEKITEYCIDGKIPEPIELVEGQLNSSTRPILPRDVENAAKETNLASAQAIPASAAETPLPTTPSASPVDMNRYASTGSGESTLALSVAQTSGMVRLAERMLAPTLAVAAKASGTLAVSSGSTTSPRLPQVQIAKSSSPFSASSKLQPGEYIKEEVDLTKAPSSRAPASTQQSAEAKVNSPTSKNAEITSGKSSDEGRSPSSVAVGGGGGSGSISGSIKVNSAPAKASSRGSATILTKEEVVTFISRGSYQQTRARLNDIDFTTALKSNSVTIFDLNGNTFGAPKGDVVFVDQGDRFVRQK